MKKNIFAKGACALVALVAVSCVAVGFGNKVKVNASSIKTESGKAFKTKVVFTDNMYFQEYEVKKSGSYEFSCKPSDGKAYWDVYVLDEQFKEGFRFIPHAYRPTIKATDKVQQIELKKGQYVYAQCSVNSLTYDEETIDTFKCPLTLEYVGKNNKTVFTDNMYIQEYAVKKTGTYEFSCNPSDGKAYWDVYVLDEQFKEGFRFISHAYDPVIKATSKPQQLQLKEGQYVYVECSVNSLTYDEDTINQFTCPITIEYK